MSEMSPICFDETELLWSKNQHKKIEIDIDICNLGGGWCCFYITFCSFRSILFS